MSYFGILCLVKALKVVREDLAGMSKKEIEFIQKNELAIEVATRINEVYKSATEKLKGKLIAARQAIQDNLGITRLADRTIWDEKEIADQSLMQNININVLQNGTTIDSVHPEMQQNVAAGSPMAGSPTLNSRSQPINSDAAAAGGCGVKRISAFEASLSVRY